VYSARRLTRGEVRIGSRFEVTVSFLGRRIPLEYRIIEFDRPSRLVLSGGDSSIRSVDELTFVSRSGGTRVTYEARLEFVGIRRLADPILHVLFQRIGRLAVRGLRERVAEMNSLQPVHEGGPEQARRSTSRNRKRAKTVRKVRFDQSKEGVS
jgi:hypothetical protein